MKPEVAFGKALKKIRQEHGLSQEKTALLGGLDRTFISLLERGLRQPSLNTIIQIAKALEISPAELIASVTRLMDENQSSSDH